jgi:hypothetical protein
MKIFALINYGYYLFYKNILKEGYHSQYLSKLALSFLEYALLISIVDIVLAKIVCDTTSLSFSIITLVILNVINFKLHNAIEFEKEEFVLAKRKKLIYFICFMFFAISIFLYLEAPEWTHEILKGCGYNFD